MPIGVSQHNGGVSYLFCNFAFIYRHWTLHICYSFASMSWIRFFIDFSDFLYKKDLSNGFNSKAAFHFFICYNSTIKKISTFKKIPIQMLSHWIQSSKNTFIFISKHNRKRKNIFQKPNHNFYIHQKMGKKRRDFHFLYSSSLLPYTFIVSCSLCWFIWKKLPYSLLLLQPPSIFVRAVLHNKFPFFPQFLF